MLKIAEIRVAIFEKNWQGLRELRNRADQEGIEGCDERMQSTVALQMVTTSLCAHMSPGHIRTMEAMLDAVERGNHPYDDAQSMAVMDADAAIAQAQIDAWVSEQPK